MSICLKFIVLGDPCTGKTSFVTHLRDGVFSNLYSSTIGVDFIKLDLERNDKHYKIYLWDTAGQDKFDFLLPLYFRNLSGLIAFYDITDEKSFHHISKWISKFRHVNKNENIPIIIVGNKTDLVNSRCISYNSLVIYANTHNYLFTECSVKKNINLEEIFYKMIDDIDHKIKTKVIIPSSDNGIKIEHKSYFSMNFDEPNNKSSKKKKMFDKCCIIS